MCVEVFVQLIATAEFNIFLLLFKEKIMSILHMGLGKSNVKIKKQGLLLLAFAKC